MKNFSEFTEGVRWYEDGNLGEEDYDFDDYLNNQNNNLDKKNKINDEEFKIFLINNNCYELFINAIKEENGDNVDINKMINQCDDPYDYFDLFSWDLNDTPSWFWNEMDQKWRDYLSNEYYTEDDDYIDDRNN